MVAPMPAETRLRIIEAIRRGHLDCDAVRLRFGVSRGQAYRLISEAKQPTGESP